MYASAIWFYANFLRRIRIWHLKYCTIESIGCTSCWKHTILKNNEKFKWKLYLHQNINQTQNFTHNAITFLLSDQKCYPLSYKTLQLVKYIPKYSIVKTLAHMSIRSKYQRLFHKNHYYKNVLKQFSTIKLQNMNGYRMLQS